MTRFIDKLVAEFQPTRAELKSIDVPELGEGTKVYWRPAWTIGERQEAYANHATDGAFGVAIDTVIAKALDVDGKELFKPLDRPQLMHHVRPAVIERIAAAMVATMMPATEEDLVKN